MFKVTRDELDPQVLVSEVTKDTDGAVITFWGVVRRNSRGKVVLYLEYQAYEEMAEKVLAEIGEDVKSKWPIGLIAIHHRIGRLEIGEASLLVVIASPHRQEAFDACHYAVERIKKILPIWKKEVWEDGSSWVEGDELVSQRQP
ncbi:MAG: molybdenum cofactor biosynthesis protein MoaE [Dehalococcoidia bacterium]|nr:molybdenum cofactor biosynthesis protein MoaE [Dehalococcoidia bacterium]